MFAEEIMRKFKYAVLISALLLSLAAFAQDEAGPGRGGRGGGRGQMPSVDDQVQRMTTDLKLSSDQQDKVRGMLQKQRDDMQQSMQDQSMSREDRMAKMRDSREATSKSIREVLNPGQQKKYDKMEQQRQEQMRQRGGGPPNTP